MTILTLESKISVSELKEMAENMFGNLVKAAVDIKREIMVIDGELHSDEELLLTEGGSKRQDVWGINLYPDFFETEKFVEFDSMINIKPSLGNRSRGIDNAEIRNRLLEVVEKLIVKN